MSNDRKIPAGRLRVRGMGNRFIGFYYTARAIRVKRRMQRSEMRQNEARWEFDGLESLGLTGLYVPKRLHYMTRV